MEFARRLQEIEEWDLEVGWPEGPTPEDFVAIVRINMLGSSDGRVPARPVLDNAYAEFSGLGAELVGRVLKGEEIPAILEDFGERVEGRVREMLLSGEGLKDNAASTIRRKGENAPLRTPGGADRFLKFLTHRVRRRG